MKHYFIYVAILAFLLIAIPACQKQEDLSQIDIESEIMKEMQENNIPSVVACIVKGKHIVWEGTFGYANIEYQIPATRNTYYTLMSISKLILATTVMQLWENELIDLDADINNYLHFDVRNPYYPDNKITAHMLLTHTSGLAWPEDHEAIPDFHHFYTHEEPPYISEWLPEYILPGGEHYRRFVWKDFAPGEEQLYSNIATSLLGLVVESITGMDYRDYCDEHIFTPLEMNNTTFWLSELNYDFIATPYTSNNNPMYYYSCRHYPAGFISTNMEDFSHFMIAFLNNGVYNGTRILKDETIDKMLTIQNPGTGTSYLWGNSLGNRVGHKGGGTGFSTWAEWQLESNSGLFIFSNKVNDPVWPGGRIYELVRLKANEFKN